MFTFFYYWVQIEGVMMFPEILFGFRLNIMQWKIIMSVSFFGRGD